MTDQVNLGDTHVQSTPANVNDLSNRSRLANEFLDQGKQDCIANAAPSDAVDKIALTTVKGVENFVPGLGHAIADDAHHLGRTAEMIGTSAVIGAALKTILPETGVAGKVAGVMIGGYFMYKAATPVVHAYSKGLHAKTMGDIDNAGADLGDAAGGFAINSVIAAGGYRVGAGFMGKALLSEPMDGFAALKEKVWNPAANDTAPHLDVLEPSKSVGLASRIKIDGDRAILLNSEKTAPSNAVLKGDVDPNAPMSVTIYAQTKGSSFLMDRYLARIGKGAAPLTDAQITDKFGAVPESVQAIEKFAKDSGLKVTDQNLASGRMELSGSTGQMMKAFDVKLQEYEHQSGVTFRGRSGAVSVKADLAPHVKAVLKLDNRPAFKPNYVKANPIAKAAGAGDVATAVSSVEAKGPTPASDGARALELEEIFKAYNKDPKLDGAGMTTGFLSLGGTLPVGWESYLTGKGLDPNLVEIRNTGSSDPTPDPEGANGENALDLFTHKQGLPKAKTVMVEAENNDSGMPTGIDRITFPKAGETQITHASVSWGQFEDGWTDQARALMEDAGKRAALKGVTVTVASGDNGAGDNSPSRKQQVDSPADLEHFTGAGGTRLVTNDDGSWKSEVGWDGMGASGGGRSMVTPRPDFQQGIKMPANLNGSTFNGRGVPDIAANADPRSGANVFTDDGVQAIGGTSLAAPETAVQAAAISQATGKTTGYWNPEIYQMAKSSPGVFHDIVSGRNSDAGIKGYPATKGYDLETGNGSIDVGKYIEARNKMLNQSLVTKNLKLVPGFVLQNHTNVPGWAVPYQPATVNDQQNK